MSKVDAQRAMREAKYEALMAQASTPRRAAPSQAALAHEPPAEDGPPKAATAVVATGQPDSRAKTGNSAGNQTGGAQDEAAAAALDVPVGLLNLCGHRSIGNK